MNRQRFGMIVGGALLTSASAWAGSCALPTGASAFPTAGNCQYDVVMNDQTGAYSAGTGVDHPVTLAMISPVMGGRQTLALGGGRYLTPFQRSWAVRSWDSRSDYRFDVMGLAAVNDRGFDCVPATALGPPDTRVIFDAGNAVGLESHFDLAHDIDRLGVTLSIVAHGNVFDDSAVELTLVVRNEASTVAHLGIRHAWNVGMVGTAGVAFGPVPPDPPSELLESREGEWVHPSFDHLLASWTNAPSLYDPYYWGGISVAGPWPLSPPPTAPDYIVRSADVTGAPPGGPFDSCFAWEAPVPPRGGTPTPGGGSNEALVYYWGRREPEAISLQPGESRSFTTWLWAFMDNPVVCDAGGPYVAECAGPITIVRVDGTGSSTSSGSALAYRWSSSDPGLVIDDPSAASPLISVQGIGSHPLSLEAGIGPFTRRCDTSVVVDDSTPPVFRILRATPDVLWPPNHKLRTVRFDIDATDACDAVPSVRLLSVQSNEPDDAQAGGDGNTVGDIVGASIGQDDREISVRAERLGGGAGRTYVAVFEATDASGNVSFGTANVFVPHDDGPSRRGARRVWAPRRP
jgi:hypothetical protein